MSETLHQARRQLGMPIELGFPLPNAPQTKIFMRLTINTASILVLLTTIYGGETSTKPALGSFVYALPDVSICFATMCVYEFSEANTLIKASDSKPDSVYSTLYL